MAVEHLLKDSIYKLIGNQNSLLHAFVVCHSNSIACFSFSLLFLSLLFFFLHWFFILLFKTSILIKIETMLNWLFVLLQFRNDTV